MTTVARRQCEAMGAWRSGPAVFRRRFRITDGAGSKGVRGDDDPTTIEPSDEGDMSDANEDREKIIYPTMMWRVVLDDDQEICLVEIVFARNLEEATKGAEGGELPGVPLGMTANQCRELAADLVEAANKLDGKKGMA
jgi:hypothetical protein